MTTTQLHYQETILLLELIPLVVQIVIPRAYHRDSTLRLIATTPYPHLGARCNEHKWFDEC